MGQVTNFGKEKMVKYQFFSFTIITKCTLVEHSIPRSTSQSSTIKAAY